MKDHQNRFFVTAPRSRTTTPSRISLPSVVIITLVILGAFLISYSKFYTKQPPTSPGALSVSELHHITLDFLKDHARKCYTRKFSTNNQLNLHLKVKFGITQSNMSKYEKYYAELVEILKKESIAGTVNQYVKVIMDWAKKEGRDFDFEEERLTGKKDQWVLDGLSGHELIFFLPPEDYHQELSLSCRIRVSLKSLINWFKNHWWNFGVANLCAILVVYLKIRLFKQKAK